MKFLPSEWYVFFYGLGCGTAVVPAIQTKRAFWFNDMNSMLVKTLPKLIKANCKKEDVEEFMSDSFYDKLHWIPAFCGRYKPTSTAEDEEQLDSEDEPLITNSLSDFLNLRKQAESSEDDQVVEVKVVNKPKSNTSNRELPLNKTNPKAIEDSSSDDEENESREEEIEQEVSCIRKTLLTF